jgi:hypothetical protein
MYVGHDAQGGFHADLNVVFLSEVKGYGEEIGGMDCVGELGMGCGGGRHDGGHRHPGDRHGGHRGGRRDGDHRGGHTRGGRRDEGIYRGGEIGRGDRARLCRCDEDFYPCRHCHHCGHRRDEACCPKNEH